MFGGRSERMTRMNSVTNVLVLSHKEGDIDLLRQQGSSILTPWAVVDVFISTAFDGRLEVLNP